MTNDFGADGALASSSSARFPALRSTTAHAIAIGLAVAVCYANSLHVPFVFDDLVNIVDDPAIASWSARGYWPAARRVAFATFKLNYALGGLDPLGFHLFNVAVHMLAALAVYSLARTLLRRVAAVDGGYASTWPPLVAALLFAVHPLQTQAVTYVVQRIASLATLFFVGALALYAWARAARAVGPVAKGLAYAAALALATLAMFTKEISFTLPVAIVLLELAFFEGPPRRRLALVLPFVALLPVIPLQLVSLEGPVAQVLSDVAAASHADSPLPRVSYLATQARVLVTYLRMVAVPVGQNIDHHVSVETSFASAAVLASAAALASLALFGGWLVFRAKREWRVVGFGICLLFLGLAVETLVPIADLMMEHRMYLPMSGLAIAVGAGLSLVMSRAPSAARAGLTVAGAALVVLAGATVTRNETWRDPPTLWADSVAKSPQKFRPRYNLGNVLLEAGDLAAAERAWREAVRLDPSDSWVLNQLGSASMSRGDLAAAEAYYRRATAAARVNPEAYYNLATVLERTGRGGEAISLYRAFFEMRPKDRPRELDHLKRRFGWN